uniref:G_PROTEIN_RECEP_F1_2 domain-containing protein n=1 Tax=Heterorhabditis bacteriophora TaxID=37862 RepID=A0A1I7XQ98_HETBA
MENVGSDKEIQWIQDNAWVVNISQSTPLDWALPLYGYLMPLLVTITTITNSFIMLVLSQKHLKTPTNIVLFAMAVTDLLTVYGLNPFWCQAHAYLFEILPSISHTAATLLTVFLAVQRYIYAAIAASFPEFAGKRRTSLVRNGKHECYISLVPWVRTIFTYKLARTIRAAENRKKSWATTVSDPSRKASFTRLKITYLIERLPSLMDEVFMPPIECWLSYARLGCFLLI